jgi:hypothetical protein
MIMLPNMTENRLVLQLKMPVAASPTDGRLKGGA